MLAVWKSECLKQKRSGILKLLWIIPMIIVVISVLFLPMEYRQTNAYNMWYMFLLPFVVSYLAGTLMTVERRHLFHGMFAILTEKKKLWYAKIMAAAGYLFLAGAVMSAGVWFCGTSFGTEQIAIGKNALACLILTVTFLWQIPLVMYVSLRMNKMIAILFCMAANILCACNFAEKEIWWIPFAIPARLMCAVLGVLPNGLLVTPGDSLRDGKVVGIGIGISLVLFVAASMITARLFAKEEAV